MPTLDDRPWHYVKPNETTRVPRKHIFLDTESRIARVAGGHVQTWRLAVACFRASPKGRPVRERWADYDTPADLWGDVDAWCGKSDRTILWTHNLAYDVRIGDVFTELPARGWHLAAHNIAPRGTWLTWRKDRSTLVMVDSAAVFPTTLAAVGKSVNMGKLELPAVDDSREAWLARCRQDVEILRKALLNYLDWLEVDDLGNWQMTGAGQSWATFRHRFLDHKMLVHSDEEAISAERRAMWTGRCEAYWHGALNGQVVHEWDFTLAYARIARDCHVPIRYLGPMPDGYDWEATLRNPNVALLAECHIVTDVPVVPTMVDGRICWPVGAFDTTLWDVEISAAIQAGATVTIGRAWLYRARPALTRWAEWIIKGLEAPDSEVPVWRKLVLKHWARALIGRMAMTYTDWQEWAIAPDNKLRRETVHDRDTGEQFELMQIGGTVWKDAGRKEWSQSMPMVTGWIQAAARVRLWDVMRALPAEALLYVDTDSILVTDRWLSTVDAIARSDIGHGLRLKRSWDGFAIYGPRQIVTGTQIRIAGVPRSAQQIDPHVFAGEVWESLSTSLRHGDASRVITRDREWHVSCVDHRRDGPALGWTTPRQVPAPA